MGIRVRNALVGLCLAASLSFGAAQQPQVINAAMEAAGTFSWIVHAMDYFGTAEANGLQVIGTTYASKQAVELALRAGEADLAVDDFLGAVILRDAGVGVKGIYPFAIAVGGLVVPANSDIQTIGDLRGKTIAAGALRDKSLLILRALAIAEYGFDPQEDGEVVAAAPPLMSQLTASGEVDAALPLWHWVARMSAGGIAREIMPVSEMLAALGLPSTLPNLIILARDDLSADLKTAFISAFRDTVATMHATPPGDPFWQTILDLQLYSLPDPSQFPQVIERWKSGTTNDWTDASIDGLIAMVDRLIELAGAEVVGVERVPREAYTTEFVPR